MLFLICGPDSFLSTARLGVIFPCLNGCFRTLFTILQPFSLRYSAREKKGFRFTTQHVYRILFQGNGSQGSSIHFQMPDPFAGALFPRLISR